MIRVTLIGRPNVGKSTLFNRLLGRRAAIVTKVPGTTRDRREGTFTWNGREICVVDTGGLFPDVKDPLSEAIETHCQMSLEHTHIVWVILDGRQDVSSTDQEIVAWVRRRHPNLWIVVNKIDTSKEMNRIHEFHTFGADRLFPISAENGFGVGDLLDALVREFPESLNGDETTQKSPDALSIAIVGRPNAGKSSLVNRILGFERVLVSDLPGTTRDVVDINFLFQGQTLKLLDTAGHKKKARAHNWPEKVALIKMHQILFRTDLVWLLIDSTTKVARRDRQLAGWSKKLGKGLIVCLHKADRIKGKSRAEVLSSVHSAFRFVSYAPILWTSARTGEGVEKLLLHSLEVYRSWNMRIPTAELCQRLEQTIKPKANPFQGLNFRLKFITQTGVRPPVFTVFPHGRRNLHPGRLPIIEKWLRNHYTFFGTPVLVKLARPKTAARLRQ